MSSEVLLGCLVLAGAALVLTLVLAWRTRRFLTRAVRTSGKVTRVTVEVHESPAYGDQSAQTTRYYTPHVEFRLEDGSPIEFRSRVAYPNSSRYATGEVVDVVYDRAFPSTTAETAGAAVWRPTIFAGLATFGLLVLAALGKACE